MWTANDFIRVNAFFRDIGEVLKMFQNGLDQNELRDYCNLMLGELQDAKASFTRIGDGVNT